MCFDTRLAFIHSFANTLLAIRAMRTWFELRMLSKKLTNTQRVLASWL